MPDLSHFDETGASRMVDTSDKPETLREARATGTVRMAAATLSLIRDRALAKGDVLEVARLAGIMAAKRTSDLIPLCHPLPLTAVGSRIHLSRRYGSCKSKRRCGSSGEPASKWKCLTAVASPP